MNQQRQLHRNSKGTILLGLLVVIGLLMSVLVGGVVTLFSLSGAQQSVVHGSRAIHRARSQSLHALNTMIGTTQLPGFNCADGEGIAGRMQHTALACAWSNTLPLSPQIADGIHLKVHLALPWDKYAEKSTRCSTTPIISTRKNPLGFPLSSAAWVAPVDCRLTSLLPTATIHQANIYSESALMTPAPAQSPYLIVSRGSLDLNNVLTVKGDSIIIAGGDVRVHELRATTSGTVRVTVISLTGTVVLHSMSPNVFIKVFAAEGVYMPPPIILGDNELLPDMEKAEVVGFAG